MILLANFLRFGGRLNCIAALLLFEIVHVIDEWIERIVLVVFVVTVTLSDGFQNEQRENIQNHVELKFACNERFLRKISRCKSRFCDI